MNINPRYFKDAKNDFAALGILPFSSKASFGSILQTVHEYHNVRIPATNDHSKGKPLPGQIQGTDPRPNKSMQ